MNKKQTLSIAALSLAALMLVVAATPARGTLKGLLARIVSSVEKRSTDTSSSEPLNVTATLDVEQRAEAAHGWNPAIANSVGRGTIIYYDENGRATGQYAITISRGYPDRIRIEIDRGQSKDISGFDQSNAWKSGVPNLKATEARDIRALARLCPERLFITRAAGSPYREVGNRVEDQPALHQIADWSSAPAEASPNQVSFDQIEVTDSLGPAPTRSSAGDIRRVYYYVDQSTALVSTARWLEPDNPSKSIDDAAALTDIRVDFGGWSVVDGIKWPFRVTHFTGGRIDFRIVWDVIDFNRSLPDNIFQRP